MSSEEGLNAIQEKTFKDLNLTITRQNSRSKSCMETG